MRRTRLIHHAAGLAKLEASAQGRTFVRFAFLPLLAVAAGCSWPTAAAAESCRALDAKANAPADASAALVDCLDHIPPGGRLVLKPGVYRVESQVAISRPVTIATAGLSGDRRGCGYLRQSRCATILLDPPSHAVLPSSMPLTIRADYVALDHLAIVGTGRTPQRVADCRSERRPLGGGMRVSGSRFTIRKSVLRGFTCYTALEITRSAAAPTVEDNVIGPNGDHRPGKIWSDGVTIHDTSNAVVRNNLFIDNTDVQLIFGGCRSCRIENNRFRHSSSFSSGSFAELMLQAWPKTSGDYSNTIVRGNSIDCGPARRCGYGLMVGSAPWRSGRMSGGRIEDNSVANAMVGLNVDSLTGPVELRDNIIRNSGGRFASNCGMGRWPGANVAPASRSLVIGDPSNEDEGSVTTAKCLLNRNEH